MNEIEKAIEDLKQLSKRSSIRTNMFKEMHGENLELAIRALEKQVELKKYLHYLQGFIKYDTLQIYEVADRIEEFIVEEIE